MEGHVGLTKRKRPENDNPPPNKKVAVVSSEKPNQKVNVRISSSMVKELKVLILKTMFCRLLED